MFSIIFSFQTGNGSTALHLAALQSKANRFENDYEKKRMQLNFLAITRMLLRVPGIIIDCKNNIGVTPLYFAVDKARITLLIGCQNFI